MKKIVFLTGTRADFGKLEPIARRLAAKSFQVTFFTTGMHMLEKYGLTKIEVHRADYAKVVEFTNHRLGDPIDIILAKTVVGFSDFVEEEKPDLIVIHGDRIEALAGAIVSATNNCLSAHIEGGEVSGTIDESLRHCITKLCSHHFVSGSMAAQRVAQLGEEHNRIHLVGSPEMDEHQNKNGLTIERVREYYDIPFSEFGLCIFHPVTTDREATKINSENLFLAIKNSRKNFIVISPNNDPGNEVIEKQISKLPKKHFRCLPSMRFEYFSVLMKHASCMIGNSSAGVREAPFFGTPIINIGSRQHNRTVNSFVRNLNGNDYSEIVDEILKVWGNRIPRSQEFGSGNASELVLKALMCEEFWEMPKQKKFCVLKSDPC